MITQRSVTPADRALMLRALRLARRGWGRVHPNPLVGAVVVRDGEIVGAGYHAEFGGDHAEVAALRAAGDAARGATLYVTLEPCSHHGKTPPCTDAVIRAGVRRVVYAAHDPTPAGGGAALLRAAGIEVVGGVEEAAARRQNAAFFHAALHPTPFVALKLAITLDGRIAAAPGAPSRVTGPRSLALVHRLRAGFSAILVGGRTARIDDPKLTVRGSIQPRTPPVRVVVSTEADLPLGSRLVETAREAPVWVVCADDAPAERRRALEARGVRTLGAPRAGAGVEARAALALLRREGIQSVWCEGGGRLGTALLAAGLVQRLYLFFAPKVFGEGGVPAFPGDEAVTAFGAGGEAGASGAGWRVAEARRVGGDALVVLEREG